MDDFDESNEKEVGAGNAHGDRKCAGVQRHHTESLIKDGDQNGGPSHFFGRVNDFNGKDMKEEMETSAQAENVNDSGDDDGQYTLVTYYSGQTFMRREGEDGNEENSARSLSIANLEKTTEKDESMDIDKQVAPMDDDDQNTLGPYYEEQTVTEREYEESRDKLVEKYGRSVLSIANLDELMAIGAAVDKNNSAAGEHFGNVDDDEQYTLVTYYSKKTTDEAKQNDEREFVKWKSERTLRVGNLEGLECEKTGAEVNDFGKNMEVDVPVDDDELDMLESYFEQQNIITGDGKKVVNEHQNVVLDFMGKAITRGESKKTGAGSDKKSASKVNLLRVDSLDDVEPRRSPPIAHSKELMKEDSVVKPGVSFTIKEVGVPDHDDEEYTLESYYEQPSIIKQGGKDDKSSNGRYNNHSTTSLSIGHFGDKGQSSENWASSLTNSNFDIDG